MLHNDLCRERNPGRGDKLLADLLLFDSDRRVLPDGGERVGVQVAPAMQVKQAPKPTVEMRGKTRSDESINKQGQI